ncbi:MAG: rRNA maturation RNase YbeY [Pseudomonadota bacterium]
MDSDSRSSAVVIERTCQDDDWQLPDEHIIEKIAEKVLTAAKWDRLCTISMLFTNDASIQALNKLYREKDKPTNVLSFPGYDADLLRIFPRTEHIPLGDIIFARETIHAEALNQHKSFDHHFTHLFVHGLLHLLGFDHEHEADAVLMEQFEIDILASLSIPNPYEVIESL